MKSQHIIHEVFWLRCIACLAVTVGHAIVSANNHFVGSTILHVGSYVVHMAVLFGVPVFIFISELLLANKYTEKVPETFMRKRVQILLLPYLVMSIVYAVTFIDIWTLQNVITRIAMSVFLGDSAVYFILVIFQFYFLHLLLRKYLDRVSAKFMIPTAFLINVFYLAFFNFTDPPNNPVSYFIWTKGYWMPFTGWIFYFVLGFYCGRNYQTVRKIVRQKWLLAMPILFLALTLIMNSVFHLNYGSKRVDMLLYASSVIAAIIYITSGVQKVPKLVMFISNYSFSIFLLNLLYFRLLSRINPPDYLNIVSYTLILFSVTLALCIGTTYILNQFWFGKYLVGKIMTYKQPKNTITDYQSVAGKESKQINYQ